MATTPRWGLRYPVGSDAADVPLWMERLATDLDAVAVDDQGTLANRPVSTPGTPGKKGRYYRATDTLQLFRDHGTAWEELTLASVWQTLLTATSAVLGNTVFVAAGKYPLHSDAIPDTSPTTNLPVVYLDDADYLVEGRTTKLRLRAQVVTGTTAPGITFTFGVYPVMAFASGTLVATLGTVVPSSTAAIANPGATSVASAVSSEFDLPTDGLYCLGVAANGQTAPNSPFQASAQLQLRHG